jgi:hypothetical protein
LLNFNTTLENSLEKDSTQAYWYLKLYYGDESSFTGISDKDRAIGSDVYYGLVSDWGNFNHALDVETFTADQRTWSISIINVDKAIEGARFSDLLSANNYENRKWELYINNANLSESSAEILGTGSISGGFSYNQSKITLRLESLNAVKNEEVPNTILSQGSFPNAPEKNRGLPIPCLFGDFSVDSSLPTPFDQYVSQVKVPAIVINEFNQDTSKVELRPDSVSLHTLYAKNLYHYKDGLYSACESSNVSVNAATPVIKFNGRIFYAYKPLTGQQDAVDRTP